MKKFFEMNGIKIPVKEFDFCLEADLEELFGLKLDDIKKKPTAFIRAYIAICMDATKEEANDVIKRHIENGGNFDEVTECIIGELENFFQKQTESVKARKSKKQLEVVE